MNLETTRAGLAFLDKGEAFAWVTVLDTRGSSPRHAGAAMLKVCISEEPAEGRMSEVEQLLEDK